MKHRFKPLESITVTTQDSITNNSESSCHGQLGVLQVTIQNISYTIVYLRLSAPPANKKGLPLFYRYKN